MAADRDWVAFFEMRFGLPVKKVGRNEYASPCPWCGGTDRFHFWTDRGNYSCRPGVGHCGRAGWFDELDGQKPLTKEELLELRVSALERKQKELEQRMTVLEKMHQCQDHLHYHRLLAEQGLGFDYWASEGMKADTIRRYLLGYCTSCPTAPGYASYTIPVIASGKLWNIRHRIASPVDGGKYRPHLTGLPSMLFNYDELKRTDSRRVLILEGEKKAMVVSQETGIPNVATMGMQNFKPEWVAKFDGRWAEVLVCYDPDAVGKAADVARLFGKRGKVVTLPAKADDFFVRHGGTAAEFDYLLSTARPA